MLRAWFSMILALIKFCKRFKKQLVKGMPEQKNTYSLHLFLPAECHIGILKDTLPRFCESVSSGVI